MASSATIFWLFQVCGASTIDQKTQALKLNCFVCEKFSMKKGWFLENWKQTSNVTLCLFYREEQGLFQVTSWQNALTAPPLLVSNSLVEIPRKHLVFCMYLFFYCFVEGIVKSQQLCILHPGDPNLWLHLCQLYGEIMDSPQEHRPCIEGCKLLSPQNTGASTSSFGRFFSVVF